ncbi:MAG: WD40/YVTN/BNR-like repeat-containing protein, partial [Chitinophagales bacterium]
HESPMKFGMIYCGTDDGNIWLTKDGGEIWNKISSSLPQNLWVSRVWASKFSEGRVYASLNGYRWDDFNPYLYVSEDYGTTWTKIGSDLPLEPINVVKEDPVNENMIYVGTDAGVYVSLDRGNSFMAMTNGLPRVAVHDLAIHPRDHDLILGTHGRSIYIASVNELEQLRDTTLQKPLFVFSLDDITYRNSWGKKDFTWDSIKGPEIKIPLYISSAGKISVSVLADSNLVMKQWSVDGVKGLNYAKYDLSFDSTLKSQYETWLNKEVKGDEDKVKLKAADNKQYYLHPGKYKVVVEANGAKEEKELEIKKPRESSSGAIPIPESESK